MSDLPARESMEFDVVVVGAGPAGLATAIRLKQQAAEAGSSLHATVGQSGQGAFPAHPDCKRCNFSNIDTRREARASLCWPERQMVLNPVSLIDGEGAIITMDRAGYREDPLRHEYSGSFMLRDVQIVSYGFKLAARHFKDRAE